MKRSSQAVRSWRAGPQVWRSGSRASGTPVLGALLGPPAAMARGVLSTRRGRIVVLSILAAAALLGGGWLWFQDSSFVAVQQVSVTGESGPDAGAIRAALVSSARSMTTLDVQTGRLYAAVSAFPVVHSLQVSTQFPHGMRIRVIEQPPVAEVALAGRRIAVGPDGTLLRDLASVPPLPLITLSTPPGGSRLTAAPALQALSAARAAPELLRARIAQISVLSGRGLVAQLRAGPAVYLGDPSQLRQKWSAALAVLDDPGSSGAAYIDVTDPDRPAAG